jgi:hypothetical protein
MLTRSLMLAAGVALCAPANAANYECVKQETAVALNDHDIGIANREAAVAEMKAEIAQTGGSTDEQKSVLEAFEEKLAKMKDKRAGLIDECAGKAAP